MQFYRDILEKSLLLTWRHKFLWWFGLFTLLWSGKGTEIEVFFSHARLLSGSFRPLQPTFWQGSQWYDVLSAFAARMPVELPVPLVGFCIGVLMLLLGAIVLWMIMLSSAALAHAFSRYASTHHEKRGQGRRPLRYSFDDAVAAGAAHWLPVLGVNLLGKFFSFGLFAFVMFVLFSAEVTVAVALMSFLLVGSVSLIVALVTRYATNYVVVQRLAPLAAFRAGWNLFANNVGVTLELLVVMVLAYVVMTILAVTVAVGVTFPLIFVAMISAVHYASFVGLYVYYYLLIIAVIYCFIVASIIFATWYTGSWTVLFCTLVKNPVRPLAHRFIRGEAQWHRSLSPRKKRSTKKTKS